MSWLLHHLLHPFSSPTLISLARILVVQIGNPTNFANIARSMATLLRLVIAAIEALLLLLMVIQIRHPTVAVAPAHSGSTITLTTDQLEDIIAQALVRAGNASSSSALSVLPGKFFSWLLDSACCNHMTPYPSFFSHTSSARHAPTIHTANGSTMLVRSIGTVSTSKISISDVFHVPKLSYNLLSVGQLAELGYRIILDYFGCIVQDPKTRQELGTSRRIGRLFEIFSLRLPTTGVSAATSSSPSLSLWHSRLGHASSSRVQQLVSRGLLGPVSKDNFDCVSCQLGKQPALPFHNSESMSTGIFDLIHSDVWGPSPINSIGGSRYFVVFVDDYSRYSWVFLMSSRDELLNIYRNFANMVKTQFFKTIKVFRSDNARELTQHAFEHILYSMELFINSHAQAPLSKTEEPKENFDTSLTLFVLSSCLPKFLYPFGEKLFSLLPMPSIVFQAQPFLIRLLMSAFLDLHLTINISDPLALPVSSFFSLMNTTNSSLVLAFVASLVMAKLKKDIDVMILLLIAFTSPAMLSFGSIVCSLRYLNFVPPSLSPLS
jgi:hypothetical protein